MLAERRLGRLFVARRAGRPVAYAGVSGTAVREYGGDPRAVAALIRAVFDQLDDPGHPHVRAPTGTAGDHRADRDDARAPGRPTRAAGPSGYPAYAGLPGDARHFRRAGAVRGPGPATTWRSCPATDGWLVRHDGNTLDLTPQQLVKLVFGPERFPDFAPELFPIEFFQWSLTGVP